ncbi:acyltransferase [Hymenobacter segetis]|uniref:Acyltransferase n=1 Tax=Hymenobacter segetis TaxID=2025509 RepID=A0ABU9LYA9_9BACT
MPTAPPSSPLAFRPELNGLRAVAVGVVVLQHWVHPPFPFGEMGRALFFVLSGYLVSGIIWKYGAYVGAPGGWGPQLRTFFIRRVLRIIPPYYLALAGCYLLPLETVQQHLGWFLLPGANLLFYKMRGWGDGCGHYWTQAVDEQFYLLWPLVLGLVGRRVWPLLGLAAVAWAFRLFWLTQFGSGMMHLLLPSSLDLFALGTLLRLGQRQAWLARWRSGWLVLLAWGGWAVGVRVFDGGPWALAWHGSFGTCIAGAAFLTINWLLGSPDAARRLGLLQPVAQWMGRRSYGFYLYHLPLFVFWQRLVYHFVPDAAGRTTWMGPLPTLLVLGPVLAGLAAASWHFMEEPLDRFKNRFQYQKPSVVAAEIA